MKIHGLQKMTLLDFPGKVACTVFLGGCDMRCPFCHNAELIDGTAPAVMEEEELLSFLKKRQGLLEGVAITGGEPLLRPDMAGLMERIRDLGLKIKLDTNGNHPDRLRQLVEAGLVDYVAMDVKNSPERYAETVGFDAFDTGRIDESIRYLLGEPVPYEFRTTVVRQFHDAQSFEAIAQWIKGAALYELQAFVDRDTVPFAGFEACTKEEMEHFADIVRGSVRKVELRGIS